MIFCHFSQTETGKVEIAFMTAGIPEHSGKQTFKQILVFLCLLILTGFVYHELGSSDFVSMDDPVYVTENPYVNQGLSLKGLRWSLDFGHDSGPYWMPLTMLSHMADCSLFGLDPSMHHLHNLLLHLLNTCLLFLFFYKVSGDYPKSLLIAALFALHPLNVESVAWVTSRKNVLSTLCFFSTMLLYVRYLKRKDLMGYGLVFLFYVLGLMAKASVITLMFSLLLFDMWPFYRFLLFKQQDGPVVFKFFDRRNLVAVAEKIPFLIVTALVLYLNFSKAAFVNEATTMDKVPLFLRLSNAVTAYVVYMAQTVMPWPLSVHYPYPVAVPLWKSVPSFLVLVSVSVYALINLKKKPYIAVGWFFFMGNLVMVSGLIQGGLWPAHADRFMYIPGIGLSIMVVWGLSEKVKGKKAWTWGIGACLIFATLSHVQVKHWKNSRTLYEQALAVHPQDMVSMVNLAFALDKEGKGDDALAYYRKIIERYPEYAEVHVNMAVILAEKNLDDEALVHFDEATKRAPGSKTAWFNKGLFHERRNETEQALLCFRQVIALEPKHMKSLQAMAGLYLRNKEYQKASELYEQALDVIPEAGLSIRYNLACVHALKNDREKALDYLEAIVADGFDRLDVMKQDVQLENLRQTARFRKLTGETP